MNVLYITNRLPFPLQSGYLRQYYFIRELSRRHRVTLLSMVPSECPAEHVQALSDCTERVITIPAQASPPNRWRKRWTRLTSPFRSDTAVSRLCATVTRLLGEESFDAAVMHGLSTVAALKHLDALRVVADLCDANSSRFLAALRYTSPLRLPLILWDYMTARRLERQFIRSRAQLVFASCRDRQELLGGTPRSATIVPNGVDLDYWDRGSTELGVNTIVFTGAMSYPPNADAAMHLVQNILPLVRSSIPQVRLLLIGRDPPRQLAKVAHQAGVTLTGAVDDIRPYLNEATVFAVPLRYGAGIQNKVLQSLAMQVPVVASKVAVEGLQAADGSLPPLEVASQDAEFAELVCRRLTSGVADRTPCQAGRKYVERYFHWSQCGQLLDQLIHSA